jgi:hypothetical protein
MIRNLPVAHVGRLPSTPQVAFREPEGLSGVLRELVQGRVEVSLVRERRLTVALAIRQLQPGMCLISREGDGRGLYIGPLENAVIELLERA